MRRTSLALMLAAACGLGTPPAAHAQTASGEPPALHEALGGKQGIARIMTRLVAAARADARIGHMFKEIKPKFLADQLSDQVCQLAGGPCRYEGETMRKAHAELKIKASDFNALVELLQMAMDEEGVAFRSQLRLLALLAPMHRDIVTGP